MAKKPEKIRVLVFNRTKQQWELWVEDHLREAIKNQKAMRKRQRAEWGCT